MMRAAVEGSLTAEELADSMMASREGSGDDDSDGDTAPNDGSDVKVMTLFFSSFFSLPFHMLT
jgi:hypothetical protein